MTYKQKVTMQRARGRGSYLETMTFYEDGAAFWFAGVSLRKVERSSVGQAFSGSVTVATAKKENASSGSSRRMTPDASQQAAFDQPKNHGMKVVSICQNAQGQHYSVRIAPGTSLYRSITAGLETPVPERR